MRAGDYRYFDTRFAALAHRGGASLPANLGRENTVHAFAEAVALGYRYLETDVHVTADGVLVAFHDTRLDRVTDATGTIAALPAGALAQVRIGGRDPIPTLDELFETFPGARFNLDLKAAGAVEPLVAAIERHAAWDRVCVGSFSTARITRFRVLAGGRVPTAVSPRGVAWYAYGALGRRLWHSAGVAVQLPLRAWRGRLPVLSRGLLASAHAAGRVVHVWTVDDADTMDALIEMGVDGIISDRIDVLRDVLTARDLWEGDR